MTDTIVEREPEILDNFGLAVDAVDIAAHGFQRKGILHDKPRRYARDGGRSPFARVILVKGFAMEGYRGNNIKRRS